MNYALTQRVRNATEPERRSGNTGRVRIIVLAGYHRARSVTGPGGGTMQNNHFASRAREVAPHSTRDRLERLISDSSQQIIDSEFVAQSLGISKRQAGSLLREYIGSVA